MKQLTCILALLIGGCATTSQGSVITAVSPTEDGGLLVRRCKVVMGSGLALGGIVTFGVYQPVEFDDCETITVRPWEQDQQQEPSP